MNDLHDLYTITCEELDRVDDEVLKMAFTIQEALKPCTHESLSHYDGGLGYEAYVCPCGVYFDHYGKHPADEWSKRFIPQPNQTLI